MKAAAVAVSLFHFDECCGSCTSSRNRLWIGWSQLILGCDWEQNAPSNVTDVLLSFMGSAGFHVVYEMSSITRCV